MIRNGFFGFQDYFKSLCDAVDGEGGDFYLIGNDFMAYLGAQV
jgi:starch phosphorylase